MRLSSKTFFFEPLQSKHAKKTKLKPLNSIDFTEREFFNLKRRAAFQKASPNIEFKN